MHLDPWLLDLPVGPAELHPERLGCRPLVAGRDLDRGPLRSANGLYGILPAGLDGGALRPVVLALFRFLQRGESLPSEWCLLGLGEMVHEILKADASQVLLLQF